MHGEPNRRRRWPAPDRFVASLCACVFLLLGKDTAAEEYVIGEGDTLQITVFGHPDLSTTVRVTPDGPIRLPLLGQVPALGLTAGELAAVITAGLADGYIIDPQVAVTVQEYRMKKSSILGKVHRPGQYDFRGRMTFLELLSRAGGLAEGSGNQAFVKRKSGSPGVVSGDLVVDLRALVQQGDLFRDIEIMDEDAVTVPEAGSIFLSGELRRPGEFRFEEGMTLARAITLAGGFSERAVTDRVTVIRSEEGRERVLEIAGDAAALNQPARQGDTIVVAAVRAEVCYVTGEVKNAGAYRCDSETNVLKAVALAGGFTDAAARSKIRIVRRVEGQERVLERIGLEEPLLPNDVLVVPKSFF